MRLPFIAPFGTSVATWNCKEALLVRLEDKGIVAWGECVADPDPYYASETTVSARFIIKNFLLPELKPDLTLAGLLGRWGRVRGNEMAKAALENALLDLLAKRRGLPLHALLGFAAPARHVGHLHRPAGKRRPLCWRRWRRRWPAATTASR